VLYNNKVIKVKFYEEDYMKFLIRRASRWMNEDVLVDEAKRDVINYDGGTKNAYSIEIDTLEELIDFYNKYGNIVIRENIFDRESIEILIYDDYIE
jgi:hypothetical protein